MIFTWTEWTKLGFTIIHDDAVFAISKAYALQSNIIFFQNCISVLTTQEHFNVQDTDETKTGTVIH